MNYTRRIDTDKAVEMQISSFTGKGGTTEYQVMVSITDPCLSFVEQLQNLLRVYVTVVKEELSNDATAVFRRYFLSDAANQTDSVMEWECESAFCPLSIVQQPPLNGTKIAMWTYLQTGMSVQTYDSGLLEASHNGYRHLWGGGAFNKAANSEYQTRLLLNDYVMQLMGQRCTLASHCVRTWFFVQNVDVNKVAVAHGVRIAAGEQQLFVKEAQLIYAKALGLPLAQLRAYGHDVFNYLLAVFGDFLCGVVHAAHVHVSERRERFKAHYLAHAVPKMHQLIVKLAKLLFIIGKPSGPRMERAAANVPIFAFHVFEQAVIVAFLALERYAHA